MSKGKGIDPSDDFKKKMGHGDVKVKIKVKGKVKPSKLAEMFKNCK